MSARVDPRTSDLGQALARLSKDEARKRISDFQRDTIYQWGNLPDGPNAWAFLHAMAPSRAETPEGNSSKVFAYLNQGRLQIAAGLAADCRRVVRLSKAFCEARGDVNEDLAAGKEWREFARFTRLESLGMLLEALA